MRRRTLLACTVACLIGCGLSAGTASAQGLSASAASASEAETIAQVQAAITALRGRIDALGQSAAPSDALTDLRRELQVLEGQLASFSARAGSPAAAPQTTQSPATALQKMLGQDLEIDQDQIRGDQFSVVRIDNKPIDTTRANFIDLPGTDAGFQLGGYAKLDVIFDPRLAGNADKFVSTTIPVEIPDDGEYSNFNVHARQTRFQLNFIKGNQQTVGGPMRFYLEADFFGGDGQLAFRMRHAYGSKSNVTAGFTWSTLTDPDSYPDTLDFEMVPGTTQNRQPQLRYTRPLDADKKRSLAFSIEKPTAEVTLVESTSVVTRFPDVIVRYRNNWKEGHFQTGVALRSIGASNRTTTTDTAFGIVGTVTGAYNAFGKDRVSGGLVGGTGAAHYISTIGGLGLDAAIDTVAREIDPVNSIGAFAAYKHNWNDEMRSTMAYGFDHVGDNAFLPGSSTESNHVFSINLIYKFAPAATTGIEYMWGDNQLLNGDDGWAQRIQFSLKYDLTK